MRLSRTKEWQRRSSRCSLQLNVTRIEGLKVGLSTSPFQSPARVLRSRIDANAMEHLASWAEEKQLVVWRSKIGNSWTNPLMPAPSAPLVDHLGLIWHPAALMSNDSRSVAGSRTSSSCSG